MGECKGVALAHVCPRQPTHPQTADTLGWWHLDMKTSFVFNIVFHRCTESNLNVIALSVCVSVIWSFNLFAEPDVQKEVKQKVDVGAVKFEVMLPIFSAILLLH